MNAIINRRGYLVICADNPLPLPMRLPSGRLEIAGQPSPLSNLYVYEATNLDDYREQLRLQTELGEPPNPNWRTSVFCYRVRAD